MQVAGPWNRLAVRWDSEMSPGQGPAQRGREMPAERLRPDPSAHRAQFQLPYPWSAGHYGWKSSQKCQGTAQQKNVLQEK